jgi:FkbM family methyltransferase
VQAELIYDVGMENGDDTARYLERGFRVVAVDADPSAIHKASSRFSEHVRSGVLTLVHAAVSDGRNGGTLRFFVCPDAPHLSSTDPSVLLAQGLRAEPHDVPAQTLDSIIARSGLPKYLKLDIEGAEERALRGLSTMPEYVSAEARTLKPLILLASMGYEQFKIVDQANGAVLPFPPRSRGPLRALKGMARVGTAARRALRSVSRVVRAMSGRAVSEHHSSGPLPWELQGRWLNDEEAALVWLTEWRALRYPRSLVERNDLWLDLHATRSPSSANAPPSA